MDEDKDWDEEVDDEFSKWGLPIMSGIDDLTEAKLNVLDRQGRVEEYLALCKKEERHLRYALKLCELKQTVEAALAPPTRPASNKSRRSTAEQARQLYEDGVTLVLDVFG